MKSKRGFSVVALLHPKFDSNIGGALRAASCYDANLVVVEGRKYKRYPTDTTFTGKHIPTIHGPLLKHIPYDCIPIGVEICDRAKSIVNFVHPERAFYIFGPEDGSINNKILDRCKYIIYIPTKFCMNLASTVNVVLYDRLNKSL